MRTFPVSEAQFQRAVVDLATILGLEVYHVPDSRRATASGFPDLVILGANGVLFRELKTQAGRLRKDQLRWIDGLSRSDLDVDVWRPSDMSGRIKRELEAIR